MLATLIGSDSGRSGNRLLSGRTCGAALTWPLEIEGNNTKEKGGGAVNVKGRVKRRKTHLK